MPIFVHCNSGVHRAPTMLAALGISDPALGISDPWLPYCLCFVYVFVKGCGSLGLCFSLFLLPISEEETIKRRRPIVQFMEEPKKSQFLGCRHLEDKLVFLFADTLKTSWYSLLFQFDFAPIWGSCHWWRGFARTSWIADNLMKLYTAEGGPDCSLGALLDLLKQKVRLNIKCKKT